MNRALIITGRGVTDREYATLVDVLPAFDYRVDVAVRGNQMVLGEIGIKVIPTMDIPVYTARAYDLLLLPGGAKAMEYLRQDKGVLEYISRHHWDGGVVASICHGAQLLISAKLVRGRKISGYYSIQDDIENAGGIYVDEPAVICERIVTSPHYKYTGQWMRAFLNQVDLWLN